MKDRCRWEARIYETGKQRFLGYYTSEVTAARAYDARAVQLHGSAAKVNFPEDHHETRGNPPAVKAFSALAVPHASQNEGAPRQKRRAPSRGASIHSATTRQGTSHAFFLPASPPRPRGVLWAFTSTKLPLVLTLHPHNQHLRCISSGICTEREASRAKPSPPCLSQE